MFDDPMHLKKFASDDLAREWLMADPKNQLLAELYIAEMQARRGGKRKTYDTHAFEANLHENLARLRDALWEMYYQPSRGTAHVIFDPVQREIFAAPYVDRVVHHFIVNNTMKWWEHRLDYESCSCRVGKGTSFGVKRLAHHILSASDNGRKKVYIIKMDISGYFMHIQRDILYHRVVEVGLNKQFEGDMGKRYKILRHAITQVIYDDPVRDVKIQGSYNDWRGLPEDKSLFAQPPGQGLVIGNLTSQFYSNVYLDPLDRFVRYKLGYQHYGRYVDDFYIVVTEEQLPQAKKDIKAISAMLNGYGLSLNLKKTRIFTNYQGVPFLGEVVRNGVILPGRRIVKNFTESAYEFVGGTGSIESIVSYMGMLSQCKSEKVMSKIFDKVGWEYNY